MAARDSDDVVSAATIHVPDGVRIGVEVRVGESEISDSNTNFCIDPSTTAATAVGAKYAISVADEEDEEGLRNGPGGESSIAGPGTQIQHSRDTTTSIRTTTRRKSEISDVESTVHSREGRHWAADGGSSSTTKGGSTTAATTTKVAPEAGAVRQVEHLPTAIKDKDFGPSSSASQVNFGGELK
jgi:hypothetical protein